MQMNQVGFKEVLFYVSETILVHPQHLQLANGVDLGWTDIDLHMGVVRPLNLLDLKRFRHVLTVTNGEDDGMAILGQRVDHADAEVAQGRVVGRRKPAQKVQNVHQLFDFSDVS